MCVSSWSKTNVLTEFSELGGTCDFEEREEEEEVEEAGLDFNEEEGVDDYKAYPDEVAAKQDEEAEADEALNNQAQEDYWSPLADEDSWKSLR